MLEENFSFESKEGALEGVCVYNIYRHYGLKGKPKETIKRPKSSEADKAKTNMENKGEGVNERVKEGKRGGQRGIEDG